jgi:hypothetical protein
MSGILGGGDKPAAPPGPDPELLRLQKQQEDRIAAKEAQDAAALAARRRARRQGGKRSLLSIDPLLDTQSAYLGIPEEELNPYDNTKED